MTYMDKVDYWLELTELEEKENIRKLFKDNQDKIVIEDDKTGVIAFMVVPDFKGALALVEVFFYLHPDHRTIRKCNKLLERIENCASIYKCKSIKFGANFGHRDEAFMNYLIRKGYKHDTVSKDI